MYTFYDYQIEREAAFGEPISLRDRQCLGAMGIAGEAGEVADLLKKHVYHGKPLDRDKLCEELGDVLWYVMYLASAHGIKLSEVAHRNNDKLRARYPDGFVKGGGIR